MPSKDFFMRQAILNYVHAVMPNVSGAHYAIFLKGYSMNGIDIPRAGYEAIMKHYRALISKHEAFEAGAGGLK